MLFSSEHAKCEAFLKFSSPAVQLPSRVNKSVMTALIQHLSVLKVAVGSMGGLNCDVVASGELGLDGAAEVASGG